MLNPATQPTETASLSFRNTAEEEPLAAPVSHALPRVGTNTQRSLEKFSFMSPNAYLGEERTEPIISTTPEAPSFIPSIGVDSLLDDGKPESSATDLQSRLSNYFAAEDLLSDRLAGNALAAAAEERLIRLSEDVERLVKVINGEPPSQVSHNVPFGPSPAKRRAVLEPNTSETLSQLEPAMTLMQGSCQCKQKPLEKQSSLSTTGTESLECHSGSQAKVPVLSPSAYVGEETTEPIISTTPGAPGPILSIDVEGSSNNGKPEENCIYMRKIQDERLKNLSSKQSPKTSTPVPRLHADLSELQPGKFRSRNEKEDLSGARDIRRSPLSPIEASLLPDRISIASGLSQEVSPNHEVSKERYFAAATLYSLTRVYKYPPLKDKLL